jgi:putative flippase GtrA
MRHLSSSQALVAALKADTLSILAFEVGLFGWMALTYFVLFPNPHLEPNQALYWFMMQIGMVIGFLTSYPMNRVLVRWGTKEAMG